MLRLRVPDREFFDETAGESGEFVTIPGGILELEHSLVSLSKWEARYKKPFLGKEAKTRAETVGYIQCMTLTKNVPPSLYGCLTADNFREIDAYIRDPMTATRISDRSHHPPSRETVTAELVYYWMIALGVPMECQYWHLNRLLTLIRVCGIKNGKPDKMGGRELAKYNTALNAARRANLHTKG